MLYVETNRFFGSYREEWGHEWSAILLEKDDAGLSRVQGVFAAGSLQGLAFLIVDNCVDTISHVKNHLGDIEETGCLSLAECMELTYIERKDD